MTNIDRLSALDQAALTVRTWDSTVIPGNLQIMRYSERIIKAAHPRMASIELRRRVLLKDRRSKEFLRRCLTDEFEAAYFVIGERAITSGLSDGADAHVVQLMHILELSKHDKISIQVLPDIEVVPHLASSFMMYGFGGKDRVGYVETIMGSYYSSRLEAMAGLHSAFSDIVSVSMSQSHTRDFIKEALTSWQTARKQSLEHTRGSRSRSPHTPLRETTAWGWRDRPEL
ncbi:DUF5753 domain-containing protein [Streptomyces sp. SID3212]|uniref:DUF5753 domain-containing protein n=1 Tax=Streptomyces sp. SID3212 TaxID=2690259 RepID=UPI001927AE46|nr:DUF5753 domain-containing protein [Streptomyces sp. SID3212]